MSNSEKNIAIVKQAFNDFLQGNIQGIVDVCADNVSWGSYTDERIPYSRKFNGKADVPNFFMGLAENLDYKRFEPNEFWGDDGNVLVRGYHQATVKSTGKDIDHDFFMHFRMKDGKVYDYFVFTDMGQSLKAFNLS